MINSVLFVCLGNICRSPLAEGIFKNLAKKENLNVESDSAGTSSWHSGESPCSGSIEVAKRHDIDISRLESRAVSIYKDLDFDLVVALDGSNYSDLIKFGFDGERLKKLGDFGLDGADIPDPYNYKSADGFEKVYLMIEKCVENLIVSIKE